MYNQLYLDSQRRVVDLIGPLSADELDRRTPACPLWSVRDVLAHLADSSVAFATGDGRWDGHDQADPAAGRTVAELVDGWLRHVPEIGQIPLSSRSWLPILHEALLHEADIRGAIGAPLLPADVLAAAWPLLRRSIEHRLAPLGIVLLRLDEQVIRLGEGTPEFEVEATQFDFWRAWFGRRSRSQIRGWVRTGDPARFAEQLPAVPPRDADLIEIG